MPLSSRQFWARDRLESGLCNGKEGEVGIGAHLENGHAPIARQETVERDPTRLEGARERAAIQLSGEGEAGRDLGLPHFVRTDDLAFSERGEFGIGWCVV